MTWILVIVSLVGVILNIKHNRVCFFLWGFTNLSWAIIDFKQGIPAQGFLFIIYFILSIWGIYEWRKNNKKG